MRKLIYPTDCKFHDDWKEIGLESPYTYKNTDKDTLDALDKECYVICGPYHSKSSKYRICKGFFHKSSLYGICFSGYEVDKNDKRISVCGPDSYFPRYVWSDFLEFLGLPIISRNKLTALIFDNYEEAKQCLDDFLKFMRDKNEKAWKKYINSPEVVKEYNDKIDSIISCLNKISDNTENIQAIREAYYSLVKYKLIKING